MKNVNAPSASSIAEMHILSRYSVFDEICSGVEVCSPHPNKEKLKIFWYQIHIKVEPARARSSSEVCIIL